MEFRELRVSGVGKGVHRAGGGGLGFGDQTRSKSIQTLPKASKYYEELIKILRIFGITICFLKIHNPYF
jgi:hypothetical protein